MSTKGADSVTRFVATITGRVLQPGDDGYDDARSTWNENIEQRPKFVVRPALAADISAAVRFAIEHSLAIAVQSTGHGAVLPCDGLLIDTSSMKKTAIDRASHIATVEPGVIWGDFNREAHRHGLVGLSGYVPGVGVVGFSLGGGIGWLSRAYGYAADSIVDATVVLADGSIVRSNEKEHSDLFWALRGGSGNFGIVASLSFRCYPVTMVYGGTLTYAFDAAESALRLYASWSQKLPDAFSSSLTVMAMPQDPHMSESVRGKIVVNLGVCFIGTEAEGAALMQPWKGFTPLMGTLQMHATSDLGEIEAGPPGGMRVHSLCNEFIELTPSVIDTIVSAFGNRSLLRMIEVRAMGGAMARQTSGSAIGGGEVRYVAQIQSTLDDPSKVSESKQQAKTFATALSKFATGRVYLSFLPDGDEGIAMVVRAFTPATFARLRAVKATYDPENRFRLNYNITPLSSTNASVS